MHVAAMIMAIWLPLNIYLFCGWKCLMRIVKWPQKRLEFHGKRYSRRQCNYCLKIKGYITVSWPSVFIQLVCDSGRRERRCKPCFS